MRPDQADNPDIGRRVMADGILTNYHDQGQGQPVVLIHGSGPGVSAWANWRLNLPALARCCRVLAPDMVGFGFTERPAEVRYDLDTWVSQLMGFLDALGLEKASLVGNSFGGAVALATAIRHPSRVDRLVLMGSAGLSFPITPALDEVWGFEPSLANMRRLLDLFAFDRSLVSDDLAELRLRAATRSGVQEAFSAMFPAPRQDGVEALASPESDISGIVQPALVIHGREDQVVPADVSVRLSRLLPDAQLHIFGRCGHWTQIEHAQEFNQLVGNFLTGGRG